MIMDDDSKNLSFDYINVHQFTKCCFFFLSSFTKCCYDIQIYSYCMLICCIIHTCYKSWNGLPLTRPGARPVQYLKDGETAEALERGEREPISGEREWRPQSLEKIKPFPFLSICNISIIMY